MAKTLSYVFGAVLLIVGILGFFNDPVLGIFEVNATHNLIHIVTGIALLALAAAGGRTLTRGLYTLGIVYALVTLLGFIMGEGHLLGLVHINGADNWLHLLLTLAFLGLGYSNRDQA